jgi:tripartite-type tricarboxylate transporter receptor subunit TctC
MSRNCSPEAVKREDSLAARISLPFGRDRRLILPFFVRLLAVAAIVAGVSPPAMAQSSAPDAPSDYPNKLIRIIVPWVGGGGTDIIARVIAEKLAADFGVPVIVDNRPGANGIIGAEIAAKSPPDGYTLVLHAVDHVINASIQRHLPYDTLKDFAAVSEVGTQPLVLVVNPAMPAKTLKDVVALAKASPQPLKYGIWGIGSLGHLAGELFKSTAGIDLLDVNYQSGSQAMMDIIGGRLDLMLNTMPTSVPLLQSGQLRAIAVTSTMRAPVLPDVPTFIESGYPDFDVESWRGMYVPAGTPEPIIRRLNVELVKILHEKQVTDRLRAVGIDAISSSPAELDALTRAELEKWGKVARQAGIHVD